MRTLTNGVPKCRSARAPRRSGASRIAHALYQGVIRQCDAVIDLHTGSASRTDRVAKYNLLLRIEH
jgi:predicted deacylase